MSQLNKEAVKELLYKMADDQLIMGHRHSEWTGLGPILEEDIAFSSMAQDKIGQAGAIYDILHAEFGENEADTIAFSRPANAFRNCTMVELPNGDYDYSIVRSFFFSHAEQLRFELLAKSTFEPLARLARKVKGELKYHVYHADAWVKRLGNANEVSHIRMQQAVNQLWNEALAMFEESAYEHDLISEGIFAGEQALQQAWFEKISPVLAASGLTIPAASTWKAAIGGRQHKHTEHLAQLVDEMGEVFRLETPGTAW